MLIFREKHNPESINSIFTNKFVSLSKADLVHTRLILAFHLGYFLIVCLCRLHAPDGHLWFLRHASLFIHRHKHCVCKMPCQVISCSILENASCILFHFVALCPAFFKCMSASCVIVNGSVCSRWFEEACCLVAVESELTAEFTKTCFAFMWCLYCKHK